jgi:hypothetical protein
MFRPLLCSLACVCLRDGEDVVDALDAGLQEWLVEGAIVANHGTGDPAKTRAWPANPPRSPCISWMLRLAEASQVDRPNPDSDVERRAPARAREVSANFSRKAALPVDILNYAPHF